MGLAKRRLDLPTLEEMDGEGQIAVRLHQKMEHTLATMSGAFRSSKANAGTTRPPSAR